METRNAVIIDASIGINSYGFLDARIVLDYGDSRQVFGDYGLHIPKNGIHGKNYTGHFIYRVLEVAGVYKWDQLKGSAVRVRCDEVHIEAIGHIIMDTWFTPADDFGKPDQEASA
jgi:hypothetical protein